MSSNIEFAYSHSVDGIKFPYYVNQCMIPDLRTTMVNYYRKQYLSLFSAEGALYDIIGKTVDTVLEEGVTVEGTCFDVNDRLKRYQAKEEVCSFDAEKAKKDYLNMAASYSDGSRFTMTDIIISSLCYGERFAIGLDTRPAIEALIGLAKQQSLSWPDIYAYVMKHMIHRLSVRDNELYWAEMQKQMRLGDFDKDPDRLQACLSYYLERREGLKGENLHG